MSYKTKRLCPICNNLIAPNMFARHLKKHENNPKAFEKSIYSLNHEGLTCQFCGRICKNRNSLCNHERLCKLNPNKGLTTRELYPDFDPLKEYHEKYGSWCKGLTKETDIRVKKSAEKQIGKTGTWLGKHHTKEQKQKISKKMLGNTNSLNAKGGRGKKGWYKGFFCSSTYELAYLIYCLDNRIPIIRCPYTYKYSYKGKSHIYVPDFLVNGKEIIEIKGYWTELVDIKTKAVTDFPIKVLYRDDLEYIFDYIEKTYNKKVDFNLSDLFDR